MDMQILVNEYDRSNLANYPAMAWWKRRVPFHPVSYGLERNEDSLGCCRLIWAFWLLCHFLCSFCTIFCFYCNNCCLNMLTTHGMPSLIIFCWTENPLSINRWHRVYLVGTWIAYLPGSFQPHYIRIPLQPQDITASLLLAHGDFRSH